MEHKWKVLLCTSFGVFFAVISGDTLIMALPTVMRDLELEVELASWIVMVYLIVITICVPLIGRTGDIFGRKKLYLYGYIIFTIGSLLCALSVTSYQLLSFRIVQSIGGALILANNIPLIVDAFPKKEMGKAMGLTALNGSSAYLLAPVIGGILLEIGDWHAIFLINIPVGIIGFYFAYKVIEDSDQVRDKQRVDWIGTLLFSVAMLTLLFGIMIGGFNGLSDGKVIYLFIVATFAVILLFLFESRIRHPMLDIELLKSRWLAFGYASVLLNGITRGTVTFLLIIYLQVIRKVPPLETGLLFLPYLFSLMIFSPLGGWLADKYGGKNLSTIGLLICSVGLFGLSGITEYTPIFNILLFMSIFGVGIALFLSPSTSSIMKVVPENRRGIAAGIRTMSNNAGNAISIAMSMAILAYSIPRDSLRNLIIGKSVEVIYTSQFVAGLRGAFIITLIISLIAAGLSHFRGKETEL